MAGIWSEIPEDLVHGILEQLVCLDDLIRFGGVCKLWRSVSISEKEKKKAYAPLMMLANAENDNDGQGMRSFVIPYGENNKMRSFNLELPKAQGRRCWGSPYGWVVTVGLDLNIGLLNPLTGAHLPLPLPSQIILQHQSLFSKTHVTKPSLDPNCIISFFIHKIALGWHQSSQSWLVMAIFGAGGKVRFTFIGNGNQGFSSSSWTCIDYMTDAEDVILFQDQIYIIAYGGKLKVYDIKEGTPPKAVHIAPPPEYPNASYTVYLVEIGGNLHFVARYYFDPVEKEEYDHCATSDFSVWRFNFSTTKWYKLNDLGEYALFLGTSTSFAISTTTYSDFTRNCIYFTDDRCYIYENEFCDMGVFDYEEKTIKPFDIANMGAFSEFSRPIFFMPSM